MSSLNEIEDAVVRLTPAELDAFRAWFAEFDAASWDRQRDMISLRDAWMRSRTKASRIAGGSLHRPVKHPANPRFWAGYRQLPDDVRQLADQSYQLLRRDPKHPSLHFKRLGRFWSAGVGLH